MADKTSKKLRNMLMYQIFVRDFSEEGTFKAVEKELSRIKELGTDIIWFMPIHPTGKIKRKGTLGSPYAISDYRAINPEFGTLEDFKSVVDEIHRLKMKCIIDVVYNHTSPDSVLSVEHPEWFYHKQDGSFGNRVGDWSDIIDLDYNNKELWDYQIETLKMWAEIVDGFRCDVAPLIPIEYWEKARAEVEKIRPECIWLSESVHPGFITYMRSRGLTALSDSEIYRAFDISYEYDCYDYFRAYVEGRGSLENYALEINRQEYIYPDNYVKLRFLENHDQTRAAFLIPDEKALRNYTAFMFFQKGMALVYAGQENGVEHLPSLFDKDVVDWNSGTASLSGLIRTLVDIKKNSIFTDSSYEVKAVSESFLTATHTKDGSKALGIFSLKGGSAYIPVSFKDGIYTNLIDQNRVEVFRGGIQSKGEPIIIIT